MMREHRPVSKKTGEKNNGNNTTVQTKGTAAQCRGRLNVGGPPARRRGLIVPEACGRPGIQPDAV